MGCLKKFPDMSMAINPDVPNCDGFEKIKSDWTQQCPDAKEDVPDDMPEPTMKAMRITVFVDADHAHDKKTRRSVTGIIALLNSTPMMWHSKRQGSVETSTFGSEWVALKTATECVIGLRRTLRMLGIKIEESACMFGDNLGMILNASAPSSSA